MNRAERRRLERAAGRKRAPSKRGRRPALRTPQPTEPSAPDLPTLIQSGFVVAKPKIVTPKDAA